MNNIEFIMCANCGTIHINKKMKSDKYCCECGFLIDDTIIHTDAKVLAYVTSRMGDKWYKYNGNDKPTGWRMKIIASSTRFGQFLEIKTLSVYPTSIHKNNSGIHECIMPTIKTNDTITVMYEDGFNINDLLSKLTYVGDDMNTILEEYIEHNTKIGKLIYG